METLAKDLPIISISEAQYIQGQFEDVIRDCGIRATVTLLADALKAQFPGEIWKIEVKNNKTELIAVQVV